MSEVRFRDGSRELPEHLVWRLSGLDTMRMTYDEAMEAANKRELAEHLNAEQRRITREHFERWS